MNEKITLQDIIDLLCQKHNIDRKEAELFTKGMFDLIEEALATEKFVKVKGLGTFKLTEVDARESVDVNTGERIEIQGHTKVAFTPDTTMKELINKPFSHFETVVLNDGVELEDTVTSEETETTQVEVSESTIEVKDTTVIETPIIKEEPIGSEESVVSEELVVNEPIVEEPVVEEAVPEDFEIITSKEDEVVTEEVVAEEPVSENLIVEEPQPEINVVNEDCTSESTEEKKSPFFLWGIIVLLVLIVLFGVYWIFFRTSAVTEPVATSFVKEEVAMPVLVEEEKPKEDTLKIVQFIELSAEELRKERVPSLADTLECQIVGTQTEHTLQNGETIIRASVRFFGTKKYWPYIVKHNMDILKDPDNIPAGIRIKIPNLVEKK